MIKNVLLLVSLVSFSAATTINGSEGTSGIFLCTDTFCRPRCDDRVCYLIKQPKSSNLEYPDAFYRLGELGDKCTCQARSDSSIIYDCEKVIGVKPKHLGSRIRGNWICESYKTSNSKPRGV